MQNVWAAQQISLNAVIGKQSTRFICIIYPGKHNGSVTLAYKARTEQIVLPPSNFGPNNFSNHWHPKGLTNHQ